MPNKNRDFSMKLFSRFGTVAEDSRSDIKLDTGKYPSSEDPVERSHPADAGNHESRCPGNEAGGLTGRITAPFPGRVRFDRGFVRVRPVTHEAKRTPR